MGQLFGFPQCPEESSSGEHQLQDAALPCHAHGSSLCHYMQSVQDMQKEQFQFGLQCHHEVTAKAMAVYESTFAFSLLKSGGR